MSCLSEAFSVPHVCFNPVPHLTLTSTLLLNIISARLCALFQKQQAAHQDERRRREKVWELKEKGLAEREERLRVEEEETRRRRQELMEEREMLQRKKEEYQRELERLREAQRRLERDKEALRRDTERLEAMKRDEVRVWGGFPHAESICGAGKLMLVPCCSPSRGTAPLL